MQQIDWTTVSPQGYGFTFLSLECQVVAPILQVKTSTFPWTTRESKDQTAHSWKQNLLYQ